MDKSNKKVFISYSWGSKEHQDWVVYLGQRMMDDTVDVVLDKWSLKEGQDVYDFMEEMVKSIDIFRVLIICDKNYKEKADQRKGGVGTETQIISPKLYSDFKQEKFIPIVVERDDEGKAMLPVYLSSRKYIDFAREENFESSYEELIRNILEAPSIPKPKLGTKPPSYITESNAELSIVNTKLRLLKGQANKYQELKESTVQEFLRSFSEQLPEFKLIDPPNHKDEVGKLILNQLKGFKPLREEYIAFVEVVSSFYNDFIAETIIEFFEDAPLYFAPRETERINQWRNSEYEIFKVIFHELFIYTIAISLKTKNYRLIAELLNSKYFVRERFVQSEEPRSFTFLYHYHDCLEFHIKSAYNMVTGFGDYLVKNLSNQLTKDELIGADTLCYSVSYLNETMQLKRWFPNSYLYSEGKKIKFFEKLSSKKHFESVKQIFGVVDVDELKSKLEANEKESEERTNRLMYGSHSPFTFVPYVFELINKEKISTYR